MSKSGRMKKTEEIMKLGFGLHNAAYKRKRAEGYTGWDEEDVIAENLIKLEQLFAKAEVPKKGRVLDIGCGAGNVSFWLEERGYEVQGIDISTEAIDWAREKLESLDSQVIFNAVDAVKGIPVPNGYFSVILDNHTLHCIIGEERKKYLANIAAALDSKGVYVLTTMCRGEGEKHSIRNFNPKTGYIMHGNLPCRYLGYCQDIIAEIENAGFRIFYQEIVIDGDGSRDLMIIAGKGL